MVTRVSSIKEQYRPYGMKLYRVELWHDGLKKHRVINGTDRAMVERKAELQAEDWNTKWSEASARTIQKQAHESSRQLALEKTVAAKAEQDFLNSLLSTTLMDDKWIDWESLKDYRPFTEPAPVKPIELTPPTPEAIPHEPQPTDAQFAPKFGLLEQFFSSFKQKRIDEAKVRFAKAHKAWEINHKYNSALEQQYLAKVAPLENQYNRELLAWKERERLHGGEQEAYNRSIDATRKAYQTKQPDAIIEYCDLVLSSSIYPDYFPKEWELEYNPTTRTLIVDYVLPAPTALPTLKEVKYIQSRKELVESHFSESHLTKLYDNVLYQVVLRSVYELLKTDTIAAIDAITFNGWVTSTDRTTGKEVTACVLSLMANQKEFMGIQLAAVEPKACFKALKGVGSSKLHSLTAIAPILTILREDRRFVASRDIPTPIDESVNLASMDWEDFEHLVREIFEAEFSSAGGEVKVTQASRDGGVDAIAFGPDPIRGGKIVIQAKRYTNTVGVSAVRDLYGTVMNEGANKGVLVTTSDYGPDAYAFAKDKPLVLLNGANLLHLLQKHGHRARINIKEAREQTLGRRIQ